MTTKDTWLKHNRTRYDGGYVLHTHKGDWGFVNRHRYAHFGCEIKPWDGYVCVMYYNKPRVMAPIIFQSVEDVMKIPECHIL